MIALALGLLSVPATAAPVESDAVVLAVGGSPLTNGLFFTGTVVSDGQGYQSLPPVQIRQGMDFEFVNLDDAVAANGHKIISIKRRKGRPLFQSDLLTKPGERSLVITSHLKRGAYLYYCSTHAGMLGRIEIVGS